MNPYTAKLRSGTRKLWAQKLYADRVLCGFSTAEVSKWSHTQDPDVPGFSNSTVRRYESSGPPTLRAALRMTRALQWAHVMKYGGVQLDIEEALRGTPRRP